jgi:hypothetical protein
MEITVEYLEKIALPDEIRDIYDYIRWVVLKIEKSTYYTDTNMQDLTKESTF